MGFCLKKEPGVSIWPLIESEVWICTHITWSWIRTIRTFLLSLRSVYTRNQTDSDANHNFFHFGPKNNHARKPATHRDSLGSRTLVFPDRFGSVTWPSCFQEECSSPNWDLWRTVREVLTQFPSADPAWTRRWRQTTRKDTAAHFRFIN